MSADLASLVVSAGPLVIAGAAMGLAAAAGRTPDPADVTDLRTATAVQMAAAE